MEFFPVKLNFITLISKKIIFIPYKNTHIYYILCTLPKHKIILLNMSKNKRILLNMSKREEI